MLKSVFIFLNGILQPHLNEYVWLHYTDRRTGDQNHKITHKNKKVGIKFPVFNTKIRCYLYTVKLKLHCLVGVNVGEQKQIRSK